MASICANEVAVEGSMAYLAKTPSIAEVNAMPTCDPEAKEKPCQIVQATMNESNCDDLVWIGSFANRKNPRWPEVVRRLKEVCGMDPVPPARSQVPRATPTSSEKK